eukprot:CAMPEP_0113832632 /NCGR_PEP_ID=MMETSP0328-20130328/7480_1 /TAXON_ID=39455 /ORGANISM="Alexandrium minutum" /LENGTH=62 /DNA_ID=CAMNT_0000800853 /DNA_START=402 /DNA_END=587 /DNA_ORIENTATION=- /assembly_acc=CAM_ASM_000350
MLSAGPKILQATGTLNMDSIFMAPLNDRTMPFVHRSNLPGGAAFKGPTTSVCECSSLQPPKK